MPKPRRIPRRQFFTQSIGSGVVLGGLSARGEGALAAPLGASLDEWEATVHSILAAKHVGRPVFVRLTVFGDFPEQDVPRWLGRMGQLATRWLGQTLQQVTAIGSAQVGQVSLALRFRDGASALASLARGENCGDGLDLLLLGNHGAVYHDSCAGPAWDETVALGRPTLNAKLLAVLQRALRSGRPEAVQGDEQP